MASSFFNFVYLARIAVLAADGGDLCSRAKPPSHYTHVALHHLDELLVVDLSVVV